MATLDIKEDAYPAKSRVAAGIVNGVATEVTSTNYSDRILVTISQEGRLSQWVRIHPVSQDAMS